MDITAHVQLEAQLPYMTLHDALTGLYNCGFFREEMALLERGRDFPVSNVMIDVDHLKVINDSLGQAAGNVVLCRVAQLLVAAFRAEDIVACIGGDEFAVLLANCGAAVVNDSLQRTRRFSLRIPSQPTDSPSIFRLERALPKPECPIQ